MTLDRPSLESQPGSLKQLLLLLSRTCIDLDIGPATAKTLEGLSSRLPVFSGQLPHRVGAVEAVEIIAQARTSLNLMITTDAISCPEEDGLISEIVDSLDQLERAAGLRARETLRARVFGLYVIIDPEVTGGRDPLEIARGALRGGARMLQLRDKLREKGQTLSLAGDLRELCHEHDALLIINDHADLASISHADGLHVGQGDLPLADARRVLDSRQIAGRSNYRLQEALDSQTQGADYLALGNIYATSSKASISTRAPTGTEALREVVEAIDVPVVAIGGINEDNVGPVARAGADAICVTSAVGLAPRPEEASKRLVQLILGAGGKA